MLAEEGGAASQRGWSLCRFGERAGVADGTAPLLVLQVAPEVAGGELDVAQGLVGTGAGVEIKAVVVGGREELRLGELGEDRGGSLTVGIPVRRGQGAGIGRLPVQREQGVRLAGRFEPGDEARVALKGQGAQVEGVDDVAVAAAPGPGQHGDAGPLRAADVATEHVPSGRDLKGRTGDGVADCYVDVLAAARPLPLRERQQGGDGGVAARAEARLGVVAEVGGRALRLPRDRHQAAHRPGDDVGPFVGGVRAVLPERRDRDEHQPWVELRQPLVAEAEPVHLPRRGGLQDDVGRRREALEAGAAGRGLQIKNDAALIGVVGEPVQPLLGVGVVVDEGRPAAGRVAAGRLDLDHIRAEVGEELAAGLSRLARQVQHAVRREHAVVLVHHPFLDWRDGRAPLIDPRPVSSGALACETSRRNTMLS